MNSEIKIDSEIEIDIVGYVCDADLRKLRFQVEYLSKLCTLENAIRSYESEYRRGLVFGWDSSS